MHFIYHVLFFPPMLVSEVQYLLSNIAQLTHVRAQLRAQMPLLPDDRAEWKQDIKVLIFLYYFCLRKKNRDVIHFLNAFKFNLKRSNLKMKIIFFFCASQLIILSITGIHRGADFRIKADFKHICQDFEF